MPAGTPSKSVSARSVLIASVSEERRLWRIWTYALIPKRSHTRTLNLHARIQKVLFEGSKTLTFFFRFFSRRGHRGAIYYKRAIAIYLGIHYLPSYSNVQRQEYCWDGPDPFCDKTIKMDLFLAVPRI